MDLHLIVGGQGVGKSATVRALTGARVFDPAWQLASANPARVQPWYVTMRSAQEEQPVPCSPAQYVADLTGRFALNGIVVLRAMPSRSCPGAQDYIDAFEAAGHPIRGVAELAIASANYKFSISTPISLILPPAPQTTANQRAASLRVAWNIV